MGLIKKLILISFSISMMMSSYIMFFWNTYEPYSIGIFFRVYSYVGIIGMLFWEVMNEAKLSKYLASSLILLALLELYTLYDIKLEQDAFHIIVRIVRMMISITALYLLNEEDREYVFKCFFRIFVLACLPSVVYYYLGATAERIPHSILQSTISGKVAKKEFYYHYPLGLLMHTSAGLIRISGIFDEPGYVGTTLALLYACTRKSNNRIWDILSIIIGITTLSLAYFLLMFVFFIVDSLAQNKINKKMSIILVLTFLVIAFVVLLNVETTNPYISFVQSKFFTDEGSLIKNNRESQTFANAYENFWNSGGYKVLIGNGNGATTLNPLMTGSSSIKCLFYDYGILGSLLYLGFFIHLMISMKPARQAWGFVTVFFLSIYQRPYVLNFMYISVFYCGISTIIYHNMSRKV